CALSLLDLGLGRYEAALGRLADAVAGPNPLAALGGLPDLVEAAVRVGQSERAREPAEWYQAWAVHTDQP
ncbi:MAG: hypothetical protein ACRDQ5_10690, partial [Sciscionella sp.]